MRNLRHLAFPFTILLTLIVSTPLFAGSSGQRNLRGITLVEQLAIRTDRDTDDPLPYDLKFASDMYIDVKDRIYVINGWRNSVYQFSPTGQYLKTFEFWEQHPRPGLIQDVAVDSKGHVYVSDFLRDRITVADSKGRILHWFQTDFKVYDMLVGHDNRLYITGLAGYLHIYEEEELAVFATFDGPLIHRVDQTGRILDRFGERRPTGNTGGLARDKDGNLYHAFPYPYQVRKFSPERMMVAEFGRTLEPSEAPQMGKTRLHTPDGPGEERELEITEFNHSILCTVIMPEGEIVNLLRHPTRSAYRLYFDVFDRTGRFLISIPAASIGFPVPMGSWWVYSGFAADTRGHLYLVMHSNTSDTLKKYRIDIIYED